jgi:NADPH:quinone reductase-like Zn-dependent oxidoreductase
MREPSLARLYNVSKIRLFVVDLFQKACRYERKQKTMVSFRRSATTTLLFALFPTTSLSFASSAKRAFLPATAATSSPTALAMAEDAPTTTRYTIPDQPARFARAKAENNQRYLDIATVYDPSFLKGKRVAVTGANRGIGLALATELTAAGAELIAIVRSSSAELDALKPAELITGIEMTSDEKCAAIKDLIKGGPIDIVRSRRSKLGNHWC